MEAMRYYVFILLYGLISASVTLADQHAVDVSGRWVGTWAGPGASSDSAEVRVRQKGSRVIGTIEFSEAPHFGTGPAALSGEVRGTTLYLSVAGGCALTGELVYSANKLAGYFNCGVYTGNSLTIYRQD